MAEWTMQLVSPLVGNGIEGDFWRPQFADDFTSLVWDRKTDVDGIPTPNAYVIEARVTEAVRDQVLNNNNYLVLWYEEYILLEDVE